MTTATTEETSVHRTEDAGGDGMLSEPDLQDLKDAVSQIVTDADQANIWSTRLEAENTRYCYWPGQDSDGRKHASNNSDEKVMPFEGASDGRHRLADMIVNEDVMLVVLASLRAQIGVKGIESDDASYAGKLEIVHRWLVNNHLGVDYIRELIRLANYVFADSPAVGLMGVCWRRELALRMERIDLDKLLELYVGIVMEDFARAEADGQVQYTEAEWQERVNAAALSFQQAFQDEENGDDLLAAMLQQMFPNLRPARARKVIRELRQNGQAGFPVPYERRNGPELRAKRIFDDWFISSGAFDFQSAAIYFEPEWLSETQVRQRQVSEGWSKTFVDKLLGKTGDPADGGNEGKPAFPEYIEDENGKLLKLGTDRFRGLYQVITAYYQAVNEDGVPGRYFVTFHMDVDEAATPRRLLDYAHGLYPGHVFTREVLGKRMLDSRGIPELAGVHQSMVKLFMDSFGDNAQLSGVPPIVTRGRKNQGALYIAPLLELPARRDGDYQWLRPPEYPRQIDTMIARYNAELDQYHGRPSEAVPESVQALHREWKVLWWLANLREVHRQMLQLVQQYMPDELLTRITNRQGLPVARSREEIQGQFDLSVTFDARDFDPEYLKILGETIKNLLMAMDRDQTIQPSIVVKTLFYRLAPDMAEAALQDVDAAAANEIEDEMQRYLQIRGGIEPARVTDGSQNYPLRLKLYQDLQQLNPQVYASMPGDQKEILQRHIEHLDAMAQQYGENVRIGQEGARRALEQ